MISRLYMQARHRLPCRAVTRGSRYCQRRLSSIVSPLNLSFDHHHPVIPLYGENEAPIIFLHGLFGSKKNNRAISKALARDLGRHVYALDLRNHGDSPHSQRHDYHAMAEDVCNFVAQRHFRDTTIIGHSMGAKVAMTVALEEPHLLSNVISVDNAPVDANLGRKFADYVRGMKRVDQMALSRQKEADAILQEYESSLGIRQFLLGNLARPEGQRVQRFKIPLDILGRALDHMGDFPFKDPNAKRFEKPSLFIRGTESQYIPDEVLPLIGRFFPLFQLANIQAGHWLISEKPEAFRQAVVNFLRVDDPQ